MISVKRYTRLCRKLSHLISHLRNLSGEQVSHSDSGTKRLAGNAALPQKTGVTVVVTVVAPAVSIVTVSSVCSQRESERLV